MTYNVMAINPNHNGSVALVVDGKLEYYIEEESCLLYTSPSPRDATLSRMPSSA